jgi:hypothetical protein
MLCLPFPALSLALTGGVNTPMLEHIECLPSALLIRTLLLLPVDARAQSFRAAS